MAEPALPQIPDDAFRTVYIRHTDMLDVSAPLGATPETAWQASTSFNQSLGLEHENDPRAYQLIRMVMAGYRRVDPAKLPVEEVHAAVLGLKLGLMLAQATGWDPPIQREDA